MTSVRRNHLARTVGGVLGVVLASVTVAFAVAVVFELVVESLGMRAESDGEPDLPRR
jgi:hypothetical protein